MLSHSIYKFISTHTNIPLSDIDLSVHSYSVNFNFKGTHTTLYFNERKQPDEPTFYDIQIQSNKADTNPCLYLILHQEHETIGRIFYIGTDPTAKCNIPVEKAGTWLMELSDHLFMIFNTKIATLQDDSKVNCITNNRYISLTMLRIYNRKGSWYESFGYQIDFSRLSFDQEYYDKCVYTLVESEMREFNRYIQSLAFTMKEQPSLYATRKILLQYPFGVEQSLGSYMMEMWKSNCLGYMIVENFIGRLSVIDGNNVWGQCHKIILDAHAYMVKYF